MKQLRMESTPSNGKTFQEWDPSFIRALKDRVDEDTDYEQQMDYYKQNYPSVYDLEFLQQNMFVIPLSSKGHKNILAYAKELMEYKNGQVAIHPRTAVENGEGMLDKDATSPDYLFDAFRIRCSPGINKSIRLSLAQQTSKYLTREYFICPVHLIEKGD